MTQPPSPPIAERRPHELTRHDHTRVDDYFWLRQRDSPKVIAYLEAENAYGDSLLAHTGSLQEELFQEIKGRIQQTDTSAPTRIGDCLYYHRVEEGRQYKILCRRQGSMAADEQILLDVNARAEGHRFFDVRGASTGGPEQGLYAWAEDDEGRGFFTLRFKDLASGERLPDAIANVTESFAWAEDGRTIFYVKQHPETLRWYQLYRHVLGTDVSDDELLYEEADETFDMWLSKTRSRQYILLTLWQTVSTEIRYLPADQPDADWRIFEPRQRHHEYSVDHGGDRFYVRTNDEAVNFRLMQTTLDATARANWEEVIPHRDDVLLEDVAAFHHHLVVSERENGLQQLRIRRRDTGDEHYLDFGEAVYDASTSRNAEYDRTTLGFRYESMTTPESEFDYDMDTRERVLVKRQAILGGFDPADYQTERLWATADDGRRVPISIVYRRGLSRDGSQPLLLYGYGSYGASMDADFSASLLSLLDRGFAFAIAHVRGGEELGRTWYEDGRLLNKCNTFTDFIACAEHLVGKAYTHPDRLFAEGGSAGGLLMGAVMNLRPDLFHGIIAHVPWVDVVTTMLDDSIPLTTSEYDEWGNPNEKKYYDYMLAYSPYDNIVATDYPHLLVTTGLADAAVQYWEPAKWVARQRALRTDGNRLVLKTEMEAGHGGPSGRYRRYRKTALDYAFLIDLVNPAD
ncbi:MAG TPA: S9 family peptidase [Candidatus Latescibacteria bacterium]|nr:oligopeptidase B [Gemmatimonadaceae bacterium]MDP6018093.1 S9 family peptidase [Candidatus Latescibacterota bacterium]HJP33816.1 S9 family peptidase [Candidatus Latescibacterota bacterium]